MVISSILDKDNNTNACDAQNAPCAVATHLHFHFPFVQTAFKTRCLATSALATICRTMRHLPHSSGSLAVYSEKQKTKQPPKLHRTAGAKALSAHPSSREGRLIIASFATVL
jgi:hypothetical protein